MRIRADDRDKATGNRYYNNLFVANTLIDWNSDRKSSEISFEEHANDTDALSNKGEGNVFWYRGYSTHEYNTFQYRTKGASSNNVVRSSTLADWQNKALTDYNSSTIQPAEPHVVDTTDHVNGWRLAAGSQVIGKGVALPDDLAPLLVDFDGQPRPILGADVGADQFTFGGEEPPPSGIPGDASGNGIVTALDASLVLQHASGLLDLDDQAHADASGDGSISAFDASLILQLITGFIACLPADNACITG